MTKEEIREKYKNKRRELNYEQCIYYSQKVIHNFLKSWNFKDKTIHCFLPIHRQKEIDTVPLINRLRERNRICVPESNMGSKQMSHKILDEHTIFQENAMGVPEPVIAKDLENISDIDVVIVPLLAVDEDGNRLGYGKGFYDRFLAQCSASTLFIGLTMFDIHPEIITTEKHDIPLHYVVTAEGVLKTGVE